MLITGAADIAEEYYVSFLLDRANRNFLAMASVEGGVEIEEVAVSNPEALAKVAIDPIEGVDAAKAAEIVAQAKFPADVADQVADVLVKLWDVFVKGTRHWSRSTHWSKPRMDRSLPSTARSPSMTMPTSDTPTMRRWSTSPQLIRSRSGEGEGPQLREVVRRSGHHRQRCRTGHEHPGRGGVRRRGTRWRQARQLLGHRWRRVRAR